VASLPPVGRPVALAPVGPLATASTALIAIACGTALFSAWSDWNRYAVVDDYVASAPGVGLSDLVSADNASLTAGVLGLFAHLAAGVVFLCWLWRARANAELVNTARHRLSRGWTTGGWICPVVNLWYPRFVVDDVWRASRPGEPNDLYSVQGIPHSSLVRSWWYAWLARWAASLWFLVEAGREMTLSTLRTMAVASTFTAVFTCVAGVLAVFVLRQITEWQSIPRTAPESWPRA
jgi:hypothetical protein